MRNNGQQKAETPNGKNEEEYFSLADLTVVDTAGLADRLLYSDDIYEINLKCFGDPDSRDTVVQLLRHELMHFFLCVEGTVGKAVAYCSILTVADEMQVINLAVLPEYRGRGIGSALLMSALRYAREHNCTMSSLEVRESNVAALSVYIKCGFVKAGVRKDFYKLPTENAIIMVNDMRRLF